MELPDFSSPLIQAYFALYYGALILAVLLGKPSLKVNWPERLSALTLALVPVLQFLLYSTVSRPGFASVDWVLLTVDMFAIIGVGLVAYNANRITPGITTAILIFGLLSHAPRSLLEGWLGASYAYFNVLPTLIAAFVVLVGAAVNFARRRRGYVDRDWHPYGYDRQFRAAPFPTIGT